MGRSDDHDFEELVWENNQILMRDRSGRTFKVRDQWRSRYASYPSNAPAEDGENMHRKRSARLETTYSTLKDGTTNSSDCRDSDLNFPDNDSSQTGNYNFESSPDVYQLNLEANRSKSDENNSTHPQINFPGLENASFKPSNTSMFVGWIPERATPRDLHREPSSFHCQSSDTLILSSREKNPVSMAGPDTSIFLGHDLNPDTKTGSLMNFSYLRPEDHLSRTPVLTRAHELKSNRDERPSLGGRNLRGSTVIGQASGSIRSATGPENQPERELIPSVAETPDQSLPHEQQSNLAANTPKEKPAIASSSACSLVASNDPTYSLRMTYEDHTDESEYQSKVVRRKIGEPECLNDQAPARSYGGGKRSRSTEVHGLSEKRRRGEKVKEKMRVLKELIPNCNKEDKVSMLDEAIEYLKTLQLQLQIMSMGNGVYYNISPIMLPAVILQRLNVPAHSTYFSDHPILGAGTTSYNMGIMGCSSPLLMHGFPACQASAFPMTVSHDAASFLLPLHLGRPSTWSLSSLLQSSPRFTSINHQI